jgi:hypothetical protein
MQVSQLIRLGTFFVSRSFLAAGVLLPVFAAAQTKTFSDPAVPVQIVSEPFYTIVDVLNKDRTITQYASQAISNEGYNCTAAPGLAGQGTAPHVFAYAEKEFFQMRLSLGRSIVVSLAGVLICFSAHATEVPLVGDAHVSSSRPATNFGTLANLYVGNGSTALLQFDLTSLPGGITAGQVSHATLTVFVNRVNVGGTAVLSPVTSAWSEPSVAFATIPSIGTATNGFSAALAGQYVTIDVTALVQGWVTTPGSNFGFALTSSAANILLDSKEKDETGHAAKLDITITSMGATGTTGAQGIKGRRGCRALPEPPAHRVRMDSIGRPAKSQYPVCAAAGNGSNPAKQRRGCF